MICLLVIIVDLVTSHSFTNPKVHVIVFHLNRQTSSPVTDFFKNYSFFVFFFFFRSTGLKTKQLQLDCEWKSVDRGWFPQGLNPRLAVSCHNKFFLTTFYFFLFKRTLFNLPGKLIMWKYETIGMFSSSTFRLGLIILQLLLYKHQCFIGISATEKIHIFSHVKIPYFYV